jgi:hypothetical protein
MGALPTLVAVLHAHRLHEPAAVSGLGLLVNLSLVPPNQVCVDGSML